MKKSLLTVAVLASTLASCSLQPYASVDMNAAHYLNPDINGNPQPVMVNVYELKSSVAFNQASFAKLNNNPGSLGPDLIDKQSVMVRPGESKDISQTLSPNTRYLGFVAAYRNIDGAQWRRLIPVLANQHHVKLYASLESQGLYIKVDK